MTDKLKSNIEEIDKDLSHSWIDLSDKVRVLAADLKLKTAGSNFASEAEHLSQETARLCDHVEKLHTDVIDLIDNLEDRIPLCEQDTSVKVESSGLDCDIVENEKIEIQRESHELRSDFKDVLKALFMWVDDPEERAREKR